MWAHAPPAHIQRPYEDAASKKNIKMKLTEKLAKDRNRSSEENLNKVYLFKEGNFFRAFDYSAWLLTDVVYNELYRQQIGAKEPLKVNHIVTKSGEDYLVAGFPIRSLSKYIGECSAVEESEEVFVVDIPSNKMPICTTESFEVLYHEYANSIPAKEQKEKIQPIEQDGQIRKERLGIFDILREIMLFQVEENSPTESMRFLIHIKKELNLII